MEVLDEHKMESFLFVLFVCLLLLFSQDWKNLAWKWGMGVGGGGGGGVGEGAGLQSQD